MTTMRLPGDKSISHRSLLLGSLAAGPSRVTGFLPSADCLATLGCMRALGVEIDGSGFGDPVAVRPQKYGVRAMRILISVDMEGISGLVRWADVSSSGIDFQRNRNLMTLDANAAIEGAFQSGATEVVVEEIYDPADWERMGMERGTPFALAHTFFQTGPFRPNNVDRRVPGLVFTGSSTLPGVGVPMVLVSGKLAAERVEQYRRLGDALRECIVQGRCGANFYGDAACDLVE